MFTQKALLLWEVLFPAELDNPSRTAGGILLMNTGVREELFIFFRSDMQIDDAGESGMSGGHVTNGSVSFQ